MRRRLPPVLQKLLIAVLLLVAAGGFTFYLRPLWVNDELTLLKLRRQGVESKYLDAEGVRLHYFEASPDGATREEPGKAIVLIHGLGARGEVWAPLIPNLTAQGFHVFAPDLLGFGRSEQPDVDYSMTLQEDVIVKFMDALELEHADVAGWSMGGWVALKLTLDHPDMVDRLVLFDAAGTYFPPTFDASLFTPADAAGLAHLASMLSPIKKPRLPGFVVRDVIHQLHQNGWVIQRSMASMETGRDLVDFRLHQVERPTLIVWGSEDRLIPEAVGETLHREIPNSSLLVLKGCGHLAAAECYKPLLPPMIQFLKAEAEPTPSTVTVDGTAP